MYDDMIEELFGEKIRELSEPRVQIAMQEVADANQRAADANQRAEKLTQENAELMQETADANQRAEKLTQENAELRKKVSTTEKKVEQERHHTMLECIQSLMARMEMSFDQAMNIYNISPAESAFYRKKLG